MASPFNNSPLVGIKSPKNFSPKIVAEESNTPNANDEQFRCQK